MVSARSLRQAVLVAALALAYVVAEPSWTQAGPAAYEYFRSFLPDGGTVVPL